MTSSPETSDRDAHEIFESLAEPGTQEAEPPPPADPAEIAATCLLEELAAQQANPFGGPELVVLEVPDEPWLEPIMKAIRPALFARPNPKYVRARRVSDPGPLVEVYRGHEFSGAKLESHLSSRLAEELLVGTSVWIVTTKLDKPHHRLPAELLATAERRLVLPQFNQAVFDQFLSRVTGTAPRQTWRPRALSMMTPSALRLAARPRQTADAYASSIALIGTATEIEDRAEQAGEVTAGAAAIANGSFSTGGHLELDDIHGMPEIVEWGRSLALDLAAYKEGKLAWSECEKGLLIFGPPGVGKTRISQAIANHCKVQLISTSYAAWQASGSGHLGDVIKAMRAVFAEARAAAPAILFLDELDSVNSRSSKKTNFSDWWRAIVNCLLELLDGLARRDGVVVLAASNDPSKIDPAILRSGRLDRQLRAGLPDAAALSKIYRLYLNDAPLAEADYERLGAVSLGSSGADVERFSRGARRRARREQRELRFVDVLAEVSGELPPPGDRSLWDTAIHESGHAAILFTMHPGRLRLVSLFKQASSVGSTISTGPTSEDMTAAAIDEELTVLLGGRAAEEIILGQCTAGCGGGPASDLALANWRAFLAETCYGLGTSLSWSELPETDELHERRAAEPEAARAAQARIGQAYERAKTIVTAMRPEIEAVAEALLFKYVLTGEEISHLLAPSQKDAAGTSGEAAGITPAARKLATPPD